MSHISEMGMERACGTCRGMKSPPKGTFCAAVVVRLTSDVWTDRHIRCDLKSPVCARCMKDRRHCQGYGLRLSWPRVDDKKRAIVVALGASQASHRKQDLRQAERRAFFVSMQQWHVASWNRAMSHGNSDGKHSSLREHPWS